MPVFADMAVVAIQKAIEEDPECAPKLHAAVMLSGRKTVQKAFEEGEIFLPWRDLQRTIGSVTELYWLYERLKNIVDGFVKAEEPEIAEQFLKLKEHVVHRMRRLAAPIFARGLEIRTRDGRILADKDIN